MFLARMGVLGEMYKKHTNTMNAWFENARAIKAEKRTQSRTTSSDSNVVVVAPTPPAVPALTASNFTSTLPDMPDTCYISSHRTPYDSDIMLHLLQARNGLITLDMHALSITLCCTHENVLDRAKELIQLLKDHKQTVLEWYEEVMNGGGGVVENSGGSSIAASGAGCSAGSAIDVSGDVIDLTGSDDECDVAEPSTQENIAADDASSEATTIASTGSVGGSITPTTSALPPAAVPTSIMTPTLPPLPPACYVGSTTTNTPHEIDSAVMVWLLSLRGGSTKSDIRKDLLAKLPMLYGATGVVCTNRSVVNSRLAMCAALFKMHKKKVWQWYNGLDATVVDSVCGNAVRGAIVAITGALNTGTATSRCFSNGGGSGSGSGNDSGSNSGSGSDSDSDSDSDSESDSDSGSGGGNCNDGGNNEGDSGTTANDDKGSRGGGSGSARSSGSGTDNASCIAHSHSTTTVTTNASSRGTGTRDDSAPPAVSNIVEHRKRKLTSTTVEVSEERVLCSAKSIDQHNPTAAESSQPTTLNTVLPAAVTTTPTKTSPTNRTINSNNSTPSPSSDEDDTIALLFQNSRKVVLLGKYVFHNDALIMSQLMCRYERPHTIDWVRIANKLSGVSVRRVKKRA